MESSYRELPGEWRTGQSNYFTRLKCLDQQTIFLFQSKSDRKTKTLSSELAEAGIIDLATPTPAPEEPQASAAAAPEPLTNGVEQVSAYHCYCIFELFLSTYLPIYFYISLLCLRLVAPND